MGGGGHHFQSSSFSFLTPLFGDAIDEWHQNRKTSRNMLSNHSEMDALREMVVEL